MSAGSELRRYVADGDAGQPHRREAASDPARRPPADRRDRIIDRRPHSLAVAVVRAADTVLAPLTLVGAFLLSNVGRMPSGFAEFFELRLTVKNLLLVLAFGLAWRGFGALCRLYDPSVVFQRGEPARVLLMTTLGGALALLFPLISVSQAFTWLSVAMFWLALSLAMLLVRALVRVALATRPDERVARAVVVGTGSRAQQLCRELTASPFPAYEVLGFVDRDLTEVPGQRFLATIANLETLLMEQPVDEVLVALPTRTMYEDIQQVIDVCERVGVPVSYGSDIFSHARPPGPSARTNGRITAASGPPLDDGRLVVKRLLDLGGAAVALVIAAPILLLAAIAIRVTSRGPVIFAQERFGYNRRRFRMYKLRTMVMDAERLQANLEDRNEALGPVFKIRDDPRLTPVGKVLRRLSIDELPQLINVLRGDMSLVGPRPLPVRDVGRFTEPMLMRRFSVRPGITCLWQISGRSSVGFDQWIQLDLRYIDEWSLGLDLLILLRTIPAVLRGTGAA